MSSVLLITNDAAKESRNVGSDVNHDLSHKRPHTSLKKIGAVNDPITIGSNTDGVLVSHSSGTVHGGEKIIIGIHLLNLHDEHVVPYGALDDEIRVKTEVVAINHNNSIIDVVKTNV